MVKAQDMTQSLPLFVPYRIERNSWMNTINEANTTIEEQQEAWEETTLQPTLKKLPESQKTFTTTSLKPIERLYTPRDLAGSNFTEDIGFPGQPPYTRGIHPTGYRAKVWTMRQFAGFGSAFDTNQRFKYLLEHGQTGLSDLESGAALIHNDFKYDNFVLDPANLTRIIAVLDWEMATLGDPLLDLGTSLGYWVDASDPPELRALGLGITALPGNLSRMELWARYHERAALPLRDPVFYYVFGLFQLAVIAQQIYARYRAGLTTDDRFAALGHAVQALAGLGRRAVALGRIDRLG